jgi:hypothetical protein
MLAYAKNRLGTKYYAPILRPHTESDREEKQLISINVRHYIRHSYNILPVFRRLCVHLFLYDILKLT